MAIRADRVGVRQDQVDVHGRVTSPSFLNELLEDLPEWTDMPVWVNGTEELLPSNNSVPVTSPILADIAYPDIRRDNQYFTYRESPTPVDGLAKIKSIKGNTLVWNQLCNGTATSTSDGITTEYDSSTHKYKITNDSRATNYSSGSTRGVFTGLQNTENSHKYLLHMTPQIDGVSFFCVTDGSAGNLFNGNSVIWQSAGQSVQLRITNEYDFVNAHPIGDVTEFNALVIDLTRMFGAGKEPTTVEEFTSLFPLPYYAYNAGTLLSFNGTGLKTTGKNEANVSFEQGAVSQTVNFSYQASKVSSATRIRCESLVVAEKNKIYKCDWNTSIYDCVIQAYNENKLSTGSSGSPFNTWFTVPFTFTGTGYVAVAFKRKDGADITPSEIDVIRPNLYLSDSESTTSLPILTYFPTGMKSAGTVYDELTPTKGITRIGAVDLGSLDWTSAGTNTQGVSRMRSSSLKNVIFKPDVADVANAICTKYVTLSANDTYSKVTGISVDGAGDILVYDPNYNVSASVTAFKEAMSGVYLYYELATPVELPTMSFE